MKFQDGILIVVVLLLVGGVGYLAYTWKEAKDESVFPSPVQGTFLTGPSLLDDTDGTVKVDWSVADVCNTSGLVYQQINPQTDQTSQPAQISTACTTSEETTVCLGELPDLTSKAWYDIQAFSKDCKSGEQYMSSAINVQKR